jgi:flagellar protein FlgJ
MDTGNSILPPTATPSVDSAPPTPNLDPAAAKKTGQDFEAFFLSQAFENMFSGVDADPIFGGGNGETIYRSLLIQQYSKVAAKSGGIGIADAVQHEILLRAQEAK